MAKHYVITFIQSLSPKEVRVVEDHISSVSALSGSSDESKQLKLFKLIAESKDPIIDEKEILKKVGTSNLSSLLYHLSDKIQDALLLTKHLQNSDIFDEREQIVFDLKKKILLIKVLYRTLNQGKTETIDTLLQETIRIAKEYEVMDVLIESLLTQKYFKGIRVGPSEFEKIDKEIDFYTKGMRSLQKANDYYFRFVLNSSFVKSLSVIEADKLIKDSIKQMEDEFKLYKCQEVNYFIHIFQILYFERQHNYNKCIEFCNKLIVILKKSKVIYSKNRMGFAWLHLCHYNVYLANYSNAAKAAQNAQKFHIVNSFNFINAKEQEFFTSFYAKKYKIARNATEELLDHSLADTGQFRKSKFVYYQACLFFAEGQFKEALGLLNKTLEIEKDKTGWNISLRILSIMVFIELDKSDEASRALESLRKYMERVDTKMVDERDIVIVKLLREYDKAEFRAPSLSENALKLLDSLSKKEGNLAWKYFSPELIPFHQWFKEKIK
jgi:hypothetical protein